MGTTKKDEIKRYIKTITRNNLDGGSKSIIIEKDLLCSKFNAHERTVRECFSELRAEKVYYFSLNNGFYKYYNIDNPNDDEMIFRYAEDIHKSIITQYNNDLKPIYDILKVIQARRKTARALAVANKIGQLQFLELTRED